MASFDITPETTKVIKQMAEKKGCTADEAAEYLIVKGVQKWQAEHRYINKMAKADKAPAKKAKAKKAAKAKGPIARKGGGKKAKPEGGAEVAL